MLTVLARDVKISFAPKLDIRSCLSKLKQIPFAFDSDEVLNRTVANVKIPGTRLPIKSVEILRNLHCNPHTDDVFKRYFLFYVLDAYGQTIYGKKSRGPAEDNEVESLDVRKGDIFVLDSHRQHSMTYPFLDKEISFRNGQNSHMEKLLLRRTFMGLVIDFTKKPDLEMAMQAFNARNWNVLDFHFK